MINRTTPEHATAGDDQPGRDWRGRSCCWRSSELVIGHSDTADLVLEDRFVSRRHALVTIDPSGQVTIRDLNSTGGTFINDERLDGPRVLRPGDTVRFADLVARFEPGGQAPETAAAAATDAATQVHSSAGQRGACHGPVSRGARSSAAADGPSADAGPASPSGRQRRGPEADGAGNTYTVTGAARSPALPGVGGLTVQLVDKNVGGDQVLASTQTGSDGSYAFEQVISRAVSGPPPQDAVLTCRSGCSPGGSFLAASAVSYSAPTDVSLDVVLPGRAGRACPASTRRWRPTWRRPTRAASAPCRRAAASRTSPTWPTRPAGMRARWRSRRSPTSSARSPRPARCRAPNRAGPGVACRCSCSRERPAASSTTRCSGRAFPADPDSLFQASPATVQAIWQQAITERRHPAGAGEGGARRRGELPGRERGRTSLTAVPPAGLSTLQEMLQPTLPEQAAAAAVRPALCPASGRLGQLLARGRAGARAPRRPAAEADGPAVLPHGQQPAAGNSR